MARFIGPPGVEEKSQIFFKCYLLLAQKKKIASGVHMPKELL